MSTSQTSLLRYLLLVLLLSSTSLAAAANLTILPANPKGQEAVRLHANVGNLDLATVRVTMVANKIVVSYSTGIEFGGEPVLPLDVNLGRFPAGVYQIELQFGGTVMGTAQFTVSDENANRPTPFPLLDYTGLWWVPTESGWGMTITQMSDKLFTTWYVYDPAGRAAWYTLQPGSWQTVGDPVTSLVNFTYTGIVYKTTGPYFGNVFTSSSVTTTAVGTGILTFTSYNRAKFDYTVEGITGSKNIERFIF